MPDLQPFAKNVSIADGPNVRDFGVMFTARMPVVKLSDGSLSVNSPVAVPFDTLQGINQLGPVRYLVAATPRHLWRLEGWHSLPRGSPLFVANHAAHVEEAATPLNRRSGRRATSSLGGRL